MKAGRLIASLSILGSVVLVFLAERLFGEGTARNAVLALGGLGALGALAYRFVARSQVAEAARGPELAVIGSYIAIVIALGLYALSTDWGLELLGIDTGPEDRIGPLLKILWPAVLGTAFCALLFMETALQSMPISQSVEMRRFRAAALSGVSLALSLVFLVSVNYATTKRDVKKDVSYLKTTRPSDATTKMVKKLGEPIQVLLFYPRVNDVYEKLRPYFDEIDKAGKELSVRRVDHALVPALAKKHRVRGNGFVVLLKGKEKTQQAENFEVGLELGAARSRLRTLDGTFQESFVKLTRQRRELHMTAGHRERSRMGADGDPVPLRLSELMNALGRSNITTTPLGMAQGLANAVPAGAPAVAVVGPREPLLPEENAALLEYLRTGGGRLVVLVDPGDNHGLEPLLAGLGINIKPGTLASERNHVRRTHTLADRTLVFTNRFSSHPTVTLASRHSAQLAAVLVQGGSLETAKSTPKGVQVVFPVRTARDVWRDLDGDFQRGPDEALEEANVMAAITVKNPKGEEGRAVVIADADFVTDQVIRNPGNALIFSDVMQWLLGQDQIVGETASEEDVKIEHTRDEDKVWFYATSFGAPVPILLIGFIVAYRRYRPKKSKKKETSSGGPKGNRGSAS